MSLDNSINLVRRGPRISFFSPIPSKQRDRRLQEQKKNDSTPPSETCSDDSNMQDLIQAIEEKDVSTFSSLLLSSKNIDVNQVFRDANQETLTLLHFAVQTSNNEPYIVTALLRKGGDPNNMNIKQKVSPLHLSAHYDYDRVMKVLVEHGGDLTIRDGNYGESCFDIVRQNVEEKSQENCFDYLFPVSRAFRKSIGTSLCSKLHDSGSDSCESQSSNEADSQLSDNDRIHGMARLYPMDDANLIDESASSDASDDIEDRKMLTTILEESEEESTLPLQIPTIDSELTQQHQYQGIGNVTLAQEDDSGKEHLADNPSSSHLILPQTSNLDGSKKPVKPEACATKPINEPRTQVLLQPKRGSIKFSSELKAGIQDMNLIHRWGNVKVDLLQTSVLQGVSTENTSKSFYNYLLLDPRVLKRVNFSGDHLKSGIIQNAEKFGKFLKSVFYMGKAQGNRPLQHLVEAKQKYAATGRKPLKQGENVDKLLEIWKCGLGVVIVSVFHHNSEREASVIEACMRDALGLDECSNGTASHDGTVVANWSQETRNQLGSRLLFNCYKSFVVDSPKMVYPHML